MNASLSASSVWETLRTIADRPGHGPLAEVSRLISFRPYETYGPHRHRRIEINYIKKGNCILRLANGSASFKQDETMLIGSDVEHYFEAGSEGATLIQLEFHPDILGRPEQGLPPLPGTEGGVTRIANNLRIMRAVQRIVNELDERQEEYEPLVLLYYTELLILLRRYLNRTSLSIGSDPAMQSALATIHTRFADPLAISDVAAEAGVSSRYLRKLFDRNLNLSPLEYLTRVRVDRAVELLRNTEMSVKEVAFACGFRSPQYFARVFRQQTGRAPKSLTR
ncbi:helix-turn-helix domain-containing protein [uncultured Rikenella sp.]|uniref:helix-turn-helix transcriptional regulator n=1 Tax=uncultured Rikenella sp. TaxID=368003 RepID=UPI0025D15E9A|nr:helix-turn-helix domain-containing protein [uncultured Rikenella sp.]